MFFLFIFFISDEAIFFFFPIWDFFFLSLGVQQPGRTALVLLDS